MRSVSLSWDPLVENAEKENTRSRKTVERDGINFSNWYAAGLTLEAALAYRFRVGPVTRAFAEKPPLPSLSLPEGRDVGDVMSAMPCIERDVLTYSDRAELGVLERAIELVRAERAQKLQPPFV